MPKWKQLMQYRGSGITEDLLIAVLFYHDFDNEIEKWFDERIPRPASGSVSDLNPEQMYEFQLICELKRNQAMLRKFII